MPIVDDVQEKKPDASDIREIVERMRREQQDKPETVSVPEHPPKSESDELFDKVMADAKLLNAILQRLGKTKRKAEKQRDQLRAQQPAQHPPAITTRSFGPMIHPKVILYDRNKLNATTKLVYSWLVMHSHGRKLADAGQKRIADELGYSVRNIRDALHALEREGFISPLTDARGNRDVYQLHVLVPPKKQVADDEIDGDE